MLPCSSLPGRAAACQRSQHVCLLSSFACTSDTKHTWFPLPLLFTCSAAIGISGSTQSIFAAEIDDSMAARSGGGGLEDHGEAIEVHLSWRWCLLCYLRRFVVSAASACYSVGALLVAPSARAGWPC